MEIRFQICLAGLIRTAWHTRNTWIGWLQRIWWMWWNWWSCGTSWTKRGRWGTGSQGSSRWAWPWWNEFSWNKRRKGRFWSSWSKGGTNQLYCKTWSTRVPRWSWLPRYAWKARETRKNGRKRNNEVSTWVKWIKGNFHKLLSDITLKFNSRGNKENQEIVVMLEMNTFHNLLHLNLL